MSYTCLTMLKENKMQTAQANEKHLKRHLIGANVTAEEKAEIELFASDVERRKVADLIRVVLFDYMRGALVYKTEAGA